MLIPKSIQKGLVIIGNIPVLKMTFIDDNMLPFLTYQIER